MKRFSFIYKKKRISLEVKECKTPFSKMKGLMFRRDKTPLLFVFKKPISLSIHSFFCQPFVAVWINKNKVIEKKFIKSWRINIRPKEKFEKLVEIPVGNPKINYFFRRFRKI